MFRIQMVGLFCFPMMFGFPIVDKKVAIVFVFLAIGKPNFVWSVPFNINPKKKSFTLVITRDNPELDPLAVLHLDNQLYIIKGAILDLLNSILGNFRYPLHLGNTT